MEVHHHTRTEKKKWHHYLWEFLMLFLAVFCGFLADNRREHFVELNREKQFIRSICEDLRDDTTRLNDLIRARNNLLLNKIDSLLYYLNMPDPDKYGKFIYYYARPITNRYIFYSNDRTIQQLKNAGNLRLIRNQIASDSIMSYDHDVRRNEHIKEREEAFVMDYIEILKRVFDGSEFEKMRGKESDALIIEWNLSGGNPHLVHKDKESIQSLINSLHFIKTINVYNQRWSKRMIRQASELLVLLKKEYHLE